MSVSRLRHITKIGVEQMGDLADSLELEIPPQRWAVWENEGTDNSQAFGAYLSGLGYLQEEDHEAAAKAFSQAT